ncbi:MAG: hypothetical protein E7649_06135, partial [Ruminococcaceae bacterium]|nr:hypothetical protein [Oscillospiraceae bacterium]
MLKIDTLNLNNKSKAGAGAPAASASGADEKNRGGLLGGIGYTLGNIGLGVGSVVDGISDLALAGGALLLGDTDYAEWVFKDNTVGEWRESLIEAYNPDEVMSFIGDVGHGVGQSSAIFLDAVAPGLGTGLFIAGISSQGISNAAAKTGEVGVKEVVYGGLSGAVEGGLEVVLGAAGKAAKALVKGGLKNVTKTAIREGLGKQILSSAAREFAEEFLSEYIDAVFQRMTQVDPNATVSLKDALYAGAVGAVSGGLTTGVVGVSQNAYNAKRGARIIENGNSDNVVNTAKLVADRLAGSGVDFEKAADWITALRGQVDAYNALSAEAKAGLRGKTILGEMQASLYFAETQANVALVEKKIKNKSLDEKEALAAYVSKLANKKYTAADIDADTDHIRGDLAVLDYTMGILDIDGAIAEDQAAQNKIAVEQGKGAMQDAMVQDAEEAIPSGNVENGVSHSPVHPAPAGADLSVVKGADSVSVEDTTRAEIKNREVVAAGETQYDLKSAIRTLGEYDSVRKRHIESNVNDKISRDYNEIVEFINSASKNTPVKRLHIGIVNNDVADMVKTKTNVDIKDHDFVIVSNFIAHIFDEHGNPKTETPRGQIAVDKNNIEDIIETVIQPDDVSITNDNQGATALKFEKDINGRNVAITITSTKKSTLTLKSAWIINKKSGGRTPSANTKVFAGTSKTNGRSSTTNIIHQNDPKVNTQTQNNSDQKDLAEKGARIAQERAEVSERADVDGAQQKSADVKSEAENADTKGEAENVEINGEAQSETSAAAGAESEADVNERRAKAEERARKWAEWEENTKPTAQELNTAREYVKGFDGLENHRRMAIIRTIRSAEGKVDEKTLRGVANLMAMRSKNGQAIAPDLEFRFAEGISDLGLRTYVGDKTLILINSDSEYSSTMRGTIAHELVHYIENKAGYDALAKYVLSIAK